MYEAWSQLVTLATAALPGGGAPALAAPAAMEAFVAAPLRAAAGNRAPGGSRPGTLHPCLIDPVRAMSLWTPRMKIQSPTIDSTRIPASCGCVACFQLEKHRGLQIFGRLPSCF